MWTRYPPNRQSSDSETLYQIAKDAFENDTFCREIASRQYDIRVIYQADLFKISDALHNFPMQGIDLYTHGENGQGTAVLRAQGRKEKCRSLGIDTMLAFLRIGIANGMKIKENLEPEVEQVLRYVWLDWGHNRLLDMKLKGGVARDLLSALNITVSGFSLELSDMVRIINKPVSRLHAMPLVNWALRSVEGVGVRVDWKMDPQDTLQECLNDIQTNTSTSAPILTSHPTFLTAISMLRQQLPPTLTYKGFGYTLTMVVQQIPSLDDIMQAGLVPMVPIQSLLFYDIHGEMVSKFDEDEHPQDEPGNTVESMSFYFRVLREQLA
jgi:hypothetical protein